MIRAGIVGFGNIGPVHAAALAALADAGVILAAICDSDSAMLELAASAYPQIERYGDFGRMVAAGRLDAVHICTPHWLHAPMAERALEAGLDVLMEKPLAMDAAEGRRLAATQRGSGRKLGLCFQNRYRPPVAEAKRLLVSGCYGRLRGIRVLLAWKRDASYYASRGGWRGKWMSEGGGVLMNQAVHSLDLIQWLGGGCSAVACAGGNLTLQGEIEEEDSVIVRMDLAGGARGLLFATNGNVEDAPVEIEILCERARLRIADALYVIPMDSDAEAPAAPLTLAPDGDGSSDARRSYWGNRHYDLIRDFYTCVQAGRPFSLDVEEGLKTLELLDACYAMLGRPARTAPFETP